MISDTCYWMADNYAIWQPWALGASVGLLILALAILVTLWEGMW